MERFLDLDAVSQFAASKMKKNNLFTTERMFCDVYCFEPGQTQAAHAILSGLSDDKRDHLLAEAVGHYGGFAGRLPRGRQRGAALGEEMHEYRDFWQAPPVDAALIHRKIGGLFLLATRLKARVNVRDLLNGWIAD